MRKIQMSAGSVYEVDTAHPLAGKRAIKRRGNLYGCEITILGIRAGAKARDPGAFVARFGRNTFLIGRWDFKVL